MKKLFIPLTLIALAGILFSSCSNSSKLAFNKRHYRSGVFVDAADKNRTINLPAAVIPVPARNPISGIPSTENSTAVNTPIVASQKSVKAQKFTAYQKIQVSNDAFINATASTKNIFIPNSWAINNADKNFLSANEQILSESNGMGGGASERDALSLLWIVIVVILILWLIGIIAGGFGLGGLINLLLVIALILLVLWLLRVW